VTLIGPLAWMIALIFLPRAALCQVSRATHDTQPTPSILILMLAKAYHNPAAKAMDELTKLSQNFCA
jgi:hypothetical protein